MKSSMGMGAVRRIAPVEAYSLSEYRPPGAEKLDAFQAERSFMPAGMWPRQNDMGSPKTRVSMPAARRCGQAGGSGSDDRHPAGGFRRAGLGAGRGGFYGCQAGVHGILLILWLKCGCCGCPWPRGAEGLAGTRSSNIMGEGDSC